MHSLDEMLSDDQVRLIEKLLHSHACMLEWQEQVLMLLGKLVTSVSLRTDAPSDTAGSRESSADPSQRTPRKGSRR